MVCKQGRLKRITPLILVALLMLSGSVWAAPLTFNTALPVSKGEFIFREQFIINKSGNDPSTLNRTRTEWNIVSTLVYGATPDFAIFATLPYTDRKLKSDLNTRSAHGIGDAKLLGRYTIYQNDFQGGTYRIASFAGLKLPTGSNNKTDSLGALPMNVQTGTGSWDALGGLVATYGTVNWEVDAQLSYQRNGTANNFKAGDVAHMDASLQYRIFPSVLESDTLSFVNGLLEFNLVHKDKNKIGSINDTNSGGTTLFITPGLQYITERYIIEGGVQIPILQNLNGTGLKNDYVARIGFRVNF